MKNTAKQTVESIIFDNRESIIAHGGTVKQYLLDCIDASIEGDLHIYFTDEEIESWEKSPAKRKQLNKELFAFLEQYDYQISDETYSDELN